MYWILKLAKYSLFEVTIQTWQSPFLGWHVIRPWRLRKRLGMLMNTEVRYFFIGIDKGRVFLFHFIVLTSYVLKFQNSYITISCFQRVQQHIYMINNTEIQLYSQPQHACFQFTNNDINKIHDNQTVKYAWFVHFMICIGNKAFEIV